MPYVVRVFAGDAAAVGLRRGQLDRAIKRLDQVRTIVKMWQNFLAIHPDPDNIRKVSSDLAD